MTLTQMSWHNMKARCRAADKGLHKDAKTYKNIYFEERWLVFENFLEDMGERPSKEYTLDRLNNRKWYSKENCKWSTRKEQSKNRSVTRFYSIDGVSKCLQEWCDIYDIDPTTVAYRLKHTHVSFKDAVTIRPRKGLHGRKFKDEPSHD